MLQGYFHIAKKLHLKTPWGSRALHKNSLKTQVLHNNKQLTILALQGNTVEKKKHIIKDQIQTQSIHSSDMKSDFIDIQRASSKFNNLTLTFSMRER